LFLSVNLITYITQKYLDSKSDEYIYFNFNAELEKLILILKIMIEFNQKEQSSVRIRDRLYA
jgi:hypothetical protein